MAGSYPDVPGYRFAYDLDGTVVINRRITQGTTSTLNTNEMSALNGMNTSTSYGATGATNIHGTITLLFPEVRSVSGVLFNSTLPLDTVGMYWSLDTTNGDDGVWSPVPDISQINTASPIDLRTHIQPADLNNITAIRFNWISGTATYRHIRNIHIYGSIPTTESPDRLRVVDLPGDDIAAQLDFGNVRQRATSMRQFKVINNSSSMTAHNITVSLNIPTDTTPTMLGQYQVSNDGIAYANSFNIGNLAPGEESNPLYVRINPAPNAQLDPWMARIIAHPGSWS